MTREERLERQKQMQKQEDSSKSFFMRGAGAVAAVGAGAALFSRTGAKEGFTKLANVAYDTISQRRAWMSPTEFRNWTIDDVASSIEKGAKQFSKLRAEQKKTPVKLDDFDNTGILGLFNSFDSMAGNIEGLTKDRIAHSIVAPEGKAAMDSMVSELGTMERQKMNRFIEDVAYDPADIKRVFDAKKEAGFSDKADAIAEDILKAMREKAKSITDEQRKQIKQDVKDTMKSIDEQFMNLDNLEKIAGSRRNESYVSQLIGGINGERKTTIGDVFAHPEKVSKEQLEALRAKRDKVVASQGEEAGARFDDLLIDGGRTMTRSNGKMYTNTAGEAFMRDVLENAAGTLPGQIMKMRDVQYSRLIPSVQHINQGSLDPVLANRLNEKLHPGRDSELEHEFFRIGKQLYKVEKNGAVQVEGLDDIKWISGRYGMGARMQKHLAGDAAWERSDNTFMRYFDIGQDRTEYDGNNPISKALSVFTKFSDPNWRGNIMKTVLTPTYEQQLAHGNAVATKDVNALLGEISNAEHLNNLIGINTYDMSMRTVNELASKTSGKASQIFSILQEGDDKEVVRRFMEFGENGFANQKLQKLFIGMQNSPQDTMATVKLWVGEEHLNLSSQIWDTFDTHPNNTSATFSRILRKELAREGLLQHAAQNKVGDDLEPGYKAVYDLVEGLEESTQKDRNNAHYLATSAIFERKTGLGYPGNNGSDMTEDDYAHLADNIFDTLTKDDKSEVNRKIRRDAKEIVNQNITVNELMSDGMSGDRQYNSAIAMNKMPTPLDFIRNLNETEKLKSLGKRSVKQFWAGRDDMEDVTSLTHGIYFMGLRLSDAMNTVGLGFSTENTGSIASLASAALTKRILPLAIGATYLEYMDDASQAATGQSVSGALATGIANVDVASRGAMDAIGLTDWLKAEKAVNPIMQYWGDHNEFQNAEERKEYYEKGYDPVRKGAWWVFGSVNEARGAEIEYWQPTFARRISSDWKDKALYDGFLDKWSHSWLPTPTNPLSPLFALTDPYWLEEKHEDDRPYPLSGPLFTPGTPWGAVLNPTVGEFIKPVKELHPYRLRNGVDAKNLIHEANEYIKSKARDLGSRNLISVDGDTFTPVHFTAFNAPTEDTKVFSVSTDDGKVVNAGGGTYGVYHGGYLTKAFTTAIGGSGGVAGGGFGGSGGGTGSGEGGASLYRSLNEDMDFGEALKNKFYSFLGEDVEMTAHNGDIVTDSKGNAAVYQELKKPARIDDKLKLEDEIALDRRINGDTDTKRAFETLVERFSPKTIISGLNEAQKKKAYREQVEGGQDFDEEQGILTADQLKHYRPSKGMEMLEHPDDIAEMMTAGKGYDAVYDAAVSWRLISGIYGYMGGAATGFGVDNRQRLSDSRNMDSFTRTFWDSNVGGLGGDAMEIARRFMPELRRGNEVNPLRNEMPDWLPDRFQMGVAYELIDKGEMRLPGKGYESLNQLHPDQFGDYGAFDRFKILADVAPNTAEYKIWREIAQKTVTDPDLKEEMDEIRGRVSQQTKKHDFYNYNIVGRGLDYKEVTVSEVLGYGKFRSGNQIYKIAGVKVRGNENETMEQVMGRYIHPGETVTVAVDENPAYQTNNDSDKSINAAIYVDGENLSQKMLEGGDATKKKNDTSAPAVLGSISGFQRAVAWGSEAIAHLDVPWLSDQFLRVRSPLEAYKAEYVYGTPYQSWEHPIDSYLAPAWERAIHETGITQKLVQTAYFALKDNPRADAFDKKFLAGAYLLNNRGAFVGAALSRMIWANSAEKAMSGAHVGAAFAQLGHVMTGGNSYADEMSSAASLGYEFARFFKHDKVIGAVAGAAFGAVYHTMKGNQEWIPDRAKKRWDIQDYFDRLTYLKYEGLYQEAAKRAKEEEGVDVEKLSETKEYREEKRQAALDRFTKMKKMLRLNNREYDVDPERNYLNKMLNRKINALKNDKEIIEGGQYTHSALIYKEAAEATMYGLKSNASWGTIIKALPDTDREFFMEFVKERDPDKREEILRYASPFIKKALSLAWGTDAPDTVSNEKYFKQKNHPLPGADWAGWKPGEEHDLKNVEMKTIHNEGMLLSDFGYYENQLEKHDVMYAPNITANQSHDSVKRNISKILQGRGLHNVEVNVTAGGHDGNKIMADIGVYSGNRKIKHMIDNELAQQT